MKYNIKPLLPLLCAVLLSSCTVSSDDIRLDKINGAKLEGVTLSQARLTLGMTVANDSRARVVVREGNLTVSDENGQIAGVLLGQEIVLHKRSSTEIEIPLIVRFNGAFGSASAIPRLSVDPERLKINGTLRIRGGAVSRKLNVRDMPLPDFLEMLGVSDLKSLNLSI